MVVDPDHVCPTTVAICCTMKEAGMFLGIGKNEVPDSIGHVLMERVSPF